MWDLMARLFDKKRDLRNKLLSNCMGALANANLLHTEHRVDPSFSFTFKVIGKSGISDDEEFWVVSVKKMDETEVAAMVNLDK